MMGVRTMNGKIFIDAISKAPTQPDGTEPVFVLVWDQFNYFWRSFIANDPAATKYTNNPTLIAGFYDRHVPARIIDQDMRQVIKEWTF